MVVQNDQFRLLVNAQSGVAQWVDVDEEPLVVLGEGVVHDDNRAHLSGLVGSERDGTRVDVEPAVEVRSEDLLATRDRTAGSAYLKPHNILDHECFFLLINLKI